MRIEEALVGRKVIYTPYEGCSNSEKEEGIITSYNDRFIFVRYGSDTGSKATGPEDLSYV